MKNISLAVLIVAVLLISGCVQHADVKEGKDNTVKSIDQQKPEEKAGSEQDETDKTKEKQMALVKGCKFLNSSDIKKICGSDVKETHLSTTYGPCTFEFEGKSGQVLKMIYYQYAQSDSKESMYDYCISKGEEAEKFVCAQAEDSSVYVFGDYYSISLGDTSVGEQKICSFEQVKDLGKLVKSRIYS